MILTDLDTDTETTELRGVNMPNSKLFEEGKLLFFNLFFKARNFSDHLVCLILIHR